VLGSQKERMVAPTAEPKSCAGSAREAHRLYCTVDDSTVLCCSGLYLFYFIGPWRPQLLSRHNERALQVVRLQPEGNHRDPRGIRSLEKLLSAVCLPVCSQARVVTTIAVLPYT